MGVDALALIDRTSRLRVFQARPGVIRESPDTGIIGTSPGIVKRIVGHGFELDNPGLCRSARGISGANGDHLSRTVT